MHVTGYQERGADYYDAIYSKGYNSANYYPLYELVLKLLAGFGSPKVLEVGCGIGDLGKLIIERGYPYRGFDFSEEGIRQCRLRCPQGDFRVGNAYNEADYRPHDYNAVVALEVLEHVDDLKVIASIPPGARLIASVPDYDDPAHLRLYKDLRKDVIERYRPYLHIAEVNSAADSRPDSDVSHTIHIFSGIRLRS